MQEIKELTEKLDVRKAQGPDRVSNWILKECSNKQADKIQKVIVRSLEEGRVPSG